MVVGVRDGEASPLEGAGIAELALRPLSDRDAREMVSRIAPGLAPLVRDRILQEAVGNPLALAELSATIRDDTASGEGLPDLLPLSARLEREFAARADDLPQDTRWLLLIAALDDRDGVSEIVTAAGVPAATITPAVNARLIEVDGQSLQFRHPLIRSAVQQRATIEQQREAHLALAGVVGDFDRAAWHRAAATDAPDESVAALLDAAADRAIQRGALTVAVAALQRAATLSADGRERGTRLLRAADVANEIGHMDVIGQMLADAEPIDVPVLEDRRQAWITALSLTGPRSPREKAKLRSVIAAAKRAGEAGQADLGLALLQFASARSWWLDPGPEIRSQIASTARELADRTDSRVVFLSSIAPEDHVDELLAYLTELARSGGARQWGRRAAIRDGRPLAGRVGSRRRLPQCLDRGPPPGGPARPARPGADDPRLRRRSPRGAGDRGLRPRRGLPARDRNTPALLPRDRRREPGDLPRLSGRHHRRRGPDRQRRARHARVRRPKACSPRRGMPAGSSILRPAATTRRTSSSVTCSTRLIPRTTRRSVAGPSRTLPTRPP